MHNLTAVPEGVADIIENMSEADKANVLNTPEDDLIQFHHGWALISETTIIYGRIKHW